MEDNYFISDSGLSGINYSKKFNYSNDGSIELVVDTSDKDSLNFVSMVILLLVTSNFNNGIKLNLNLDMKIIKNVVDNSKYKIIFGDFPIREDFKNIINPMMRNMIDDQANSYKNATNYFNILSNISKELAITLLIINDYMANGNGEFQVAIKNMKDNYDIVFGINNQYENIKSYFDLAGASVNMDGNQNYIIKLSSNDGYRQQMVLTSVLNNLKNVKNVSSSINTQKKISSYDNKQLNQAANVTPIFLTVVAVTELLLFGLYLFFTR